MNLTNILQGLPTWAKTIVTFLVAFIPAIINVIQTGGLPTTESGWFADVWQALLAMGLLHLPSMSGNAVASANAINPPPKAVKSAIAIFLLLGTAATLTACNAAQDASVEAALPGVQAGVQKAAASPYGQLFCQLDAGGGGQIVVGLIDASLSAANQPTAVLATNAAQTLVQQECSLAATAAGAKAGVPVSPPTSAVGNVAIKVPVSN